MGHKPQSSDNRPKKGRKFVRLSNIPSEHDEEEATIDLYAILLSQNDRTKMSPELQRFLSCYDGAQTGNAAAQYELARCYNLGIGTPPFDEGAARYFKLAADQRHPEACQEIAVFYHNGQRGLKQSFVDAFKYYKLAADQGLAQSQYEVGLLYEKGKGIEESIEQAIKYYKLAANQGNLEACFKLALFYQRGFGVKRSDEEALRYFKVLFDVDDVRGHVGIGYFYEHGLANFPQSYEETFKYYKYAADRGYMPAQHVVATYFGSGRGVEQSHEQALKYYKLAAEQGLAFSQYSLGMYFEKGLGVEQSYEEAVKYFKLAADQGEPFACKRLGMYYQQGLGGLEQSTEMADKYDKLAQPRQENIEPIYKIENRKMIFPRK